jgi:hypothetical protein
MVFTATVLAKTLPHEAKLRLEASNVSVEVTGRFVAFKRFAERHVRRQFT